MNLLIVDDEIVTTQVLEEQLDRALLSIDQIYVAYNTSMARDILQKNKVELILCDIEMPKENGIHFLEWVREQKIQTEVIFLTSHEKFEYAYGAVQNGAANYLLKPIDEARLEKTLARLRQERSKQDVSLLPENQQALKFIPCTGHSRIYLLQMKDVAFVSSRMSGVYVTSHEGKEGFTELTLRTLESRTPLLRCHRQYLVNLAHLQEIRLEDNGQAELILRNGLTVPVSRRYLKSLKEAIGL